MKFVTALALFMITCLNAEEGYEKLYINPEQLSFTNEGIFLVTNCHLFQLPSISYDYETHRYFLQNNQNGVTFSKCSFCGYNSWWVEGSCCVLARCKKYCY